MGERSTQIRSGLAQKPPGYQAADQGSKALLPLVAHDLGSAVADIDSAVHGASFENEKAVNRGTC